MNASPFSAELAGLGGETRLTVVDGRILLTISNDSRTASVVIGSVDADRLADLLQTAATFARASRKEAA